MAKKSNKDEPNVLIMEDVDTQQKAKAQEDYTRLLDRVLKQKTMTDTEAWKDLYRTVQVEIQEHGKQVLDAEKAREVVHHQEGVKILRRMVSLAKTPVDELNAFVNAMPLFSSEFKTRAAWNEALGVVELKSV